MTREEAIAILQSMIPTPCRADGKSTTHTLATIALDMAIKALGQTEPEQQHGHWIDEGQYADGHSAHAYRCSKCGGHIIECRPDDFCKHCGADMMEVDG